MESPAESFERAVQLFSAGQTAAAEQLCRQIVVENAGRSDAWHLLGVLALQDGRQQVAANCLQRSLAISPSDAEAWSNLGIALKNLGQSPAAIDCFRRAIALQPDFAGAHYNLANALLEMGLVDDAVAGYRRAIEVQPAYAEPHFNLGAIYQQQNRDDEAIRCYRRVLELNPTSAEAYANLGSIFQNQERLDEAADCFRKALALAPQNVEMHHNLACIVLAQGDLVEAATHFDRVLAIQPDHGEARFSRATFSLLAGDFARGWPDFEWRWKTQQQRPRQFGQPRWTGEPLRGRTILVHAEQGLGDTIQFVRYLWLVKDRGGIVHFECPEPLCRILAGVRGCDRLVRQGDDLPPFDVHVPLLSLPGILKTTLDTIPADVPYLSAEVDLVAQWRERMAHINGVRIGINWRGRPGRGAVCRRDIPLDCFATLAALPGVRLISLQHGSGRDELAGISNRLPIVDLGEDVDTAQGPFMDTAAILKNLDLVITSDTAIAHLAGALGVPTWLALPYLPDWRWLLDRSDSPWYPAMRLFRQKSLADWTSVFQEIHAALPLTD